ncbi:MAG: thiamine-phosphate kinase [Gammaproteobacteria bacterium]|nr:thiamine-phosphate kinase [Gammaproteobacteria bacterium]
MASSEFELIATYFSGIGTARKDVHLGIGDDCALLQVPPGQLLAISMDTLVEEVHFLAGTDPELLGHKALAVNLSDLAATGAVPAWATLALTLPQSDPDWLAGFSRGFRRLAERYGVQLVGGDTTRGPLSVTVQVHGFVEADNALRRDGARPGDRIGVTGSLGGAALVLKIRNKEYSAMRLNTDLSRRMDQPQPRVEAGLVLSTLAHAAIDISDGLAADLGHICAQSGVGGRVALAELPLSDAVRGYVDATGDWSLPLEGGDDYELCFTAAPERCEAIEVGMRQAGCRLSWIGVVEQSPELRWIHPSGGALVGSAGGYDHFQAR